MSGAGSTHEIWEMHAIFWFENLMGRDNAEDLSVDGNIILE
jgi:hypothetical protein